MKVLGVCVFPGDMFTWGTHVMWKHVDVIYRSTVCLFSQCGPPYKSHPPLVWSALFQTLMRDQRSNFSGLLQDKGHAPPCLCTQTLRAAPECEPHMEFHTWVSFPGTWRLWLMWVTELQPAPPPELTKGKTSGPELPQINIAITIVTTPVIMPAHPRHSNVLLLQCCVTNKQTTPSPFAEVNSTSQKSRMIYELKKRLFKNLRLRRNQDFQISMQAPFLGPSQPIQRSLIFRLLYENPFLCVKIPLFQFNSFDFWTLSTTSAKHKIARLCPSRLVQSILSDCQQSLHCNAATDIITTPCSIFFFLDGTPQRAICSTICLGDAADIFTGLSHFHFTKSPFPGTQKRGFLKDSKTQAMG